jgi:hypothetical protein
MESFGLIALIVLAGLAAAAVVVWTLGGGWMRYTLQRTRPRAPAAAVTTTPTPTRVPKRVVVPVRAGSVARVPDINASAQDLTPPAVRVASTTPAIMAATHGDDGTEGAPWPSTSWPATEPFAISQLSAQYAETQPMPLHPISTRH